MAVLDEILASLQQLNCRMGSIEEQNVRMAELLGNLAEDLQGTASIERAPLITVKVWNRSMSGHGFLAQDTNSTEVFLVSAAHIIVGLLGGDGKVQISGAANLEECSLDLTFNDAFCSREYVVSGMSDVGALQLSATSRDEVRQHFTLQPWDDWDCSLPPVDGNISGSLLIAKGTDIFMRGHVASVEDGRLLVHMVSAPGCSGTPLLQNGKLVAVCHGESKHRGRLHVLPGYGEATATVYVDGISQRLFKVPIACVGLLQAFERIDPKCFESGLTPLAMEAAVSPEVYAEWQLLLGETLENKTLSAAHQMVWNKIDIPGLTWLTTAPWRVLRREADAI